MDTFHWKGATLFWIGYFALTAYLRGHSSMDIQAPLMHPLWYAIRKDPSGLAAAGAVVMCVTAVWFYVMNEHEWKSGES